MKSTTNNSSANITVVSGHGGPIISLHIHVWARDQLLALAASSHPRCGSSSPARFLASQPALLPQLWDYCLSLVPPVNSVSLTSRPPHTSWPKTTSIGVVVKGENDKRQLLTFGVSRSLVGVVGPVCVSPAWSSPPGKLSHGFPECVAVGNTFHALEAYETYYYRTGDTMLRQYTLKLPPQPPQPTAKATKATSAARYNNSNQSGEGLWVLRDNESILSSGAYISRISDCISQRNGKHASSPAVCTLRDPCLLGFFFSKTNPDEAAMVTANHRMYHKVKFYIITVIDVETTFKAHTAMQLSQTKWMIYDCDVAIRSGMIFHNQTTGSRTFVVVTEKYGPFEPQELFVVEEGTGSQRRFEFPFQAVSQLNDTVFCVSLSSEYQLWEARVDRQRPLRRVSICSPDVVTAECGLLFHRTQGGNVINVTHALTGALILSFTVSPHATTHPSGFLL
ncbi:hypothetical protein Pelo_17665 [Pelomyxa schiedti]|nr:hypothetical protein Pelo_17665 [Pelomyxa schiedti]